MVLPNALWLSIIAAVTMVINSQYPDLWWSPVALAALVAVGKLIQVNVEPAGPPAGTMGVPRGQEQKRSKVVEWLVG